MSTQANEKARGLSEIVLLLGFATGMSPTTRIDILLLRLKIHINVDNSARPPFA